MVTVDSEKKQFKPTTNPLIWFTVMALAAAIVLWLFISGYKKGVATGIVSPRKEQTIKNQVNAVDMQELKIPTPELINKGQALFQVNCASCHGSKGMGDGNRAAELNPRPRNFHEEKFRYGARPSEIFNTITNGSSGTSMPSFALLSPADRWALVHFVRSQIPNPPPPAEEEQNEKVASAPTAATNHQSTITATSILTPQIAEGPRIPIHLAMRRLAEPVTEIQPETSLVLEKRGVVLYARYCMPCHGPAGESRQTVYLLRVNPDRFVRSGNLQNPAAAWAKDQNRFVEIVTKGFPGHLMPGLKTLEQADLNALYSYVLQLAKKPNNK